MINKLLLVNCGKDTRLLKYLTDSGYIVDFCGPEQLVEYCKAVPPQIILILNLQDCETLVKVLSGPQLKDIPAIHVTTRDLLSDSTSDSTLCNIIKQVNIYKSLLNMKIISDKITNIIEKQVDMQNAI